MIASADFNNIPTSCTSLTILRELQEKYNEPVQDATLQAYFTLLSFAAAGKRASMINNNPYPQLVTVRQDGLVTVSADSQNKFDEGVRILQNNLYSISSKVIQAIFELREKQLTGDVISVNDMLMLPDLSALPAHLQEYVIAMRHSLFAVPIYRLKKVFSDERKKKPFRFIRVSLQDLFRDPRVNGTYLEAKNFLSSIENSNLPYDELALDRTLPRALVILMGINQKELWELYSQTLKDYTSYRYYHP
ncbi:MAG: hypothetical protein QY312_01280 [Candidatus Dojkabacteria bacterium]|nr:MAG: hypothetical protein QY312_01280 [Candidatus Dojkabacteria bacterium]